MSLEAGLEKLRNEVQTRALPGRETREWWPISPGLTGCKFASFFWFDSCEPADTKTRVLFLPPALITP
jgi:hypothetical protein